MIDAVMYGMMPRAKIVSRRSWPPLNRSMNPRKVPRFWSKNCASTSALMPGVGMCPPEPVHGQQSERKQNALAQIGNAKYVGQLLKH